MSSSDDQHSSPGKINSQIPPWLQKMADLIATFFGSGRLKPAPGTWGTLAALPFVYLISQAGILVYMLAIVILLPISIYAADLYEKARGGHDYKEIVIDEVVGIFITMTWLPNTWQSYVFGFILFRFLDITKPFPIKYLDKNVQGGLGVVVDDLVAGLVANVVLQIIYAKTMWLGAQYITITS